MNSYLFLTITILVIAVDYSHQQSTLPSVIDFVHFEALVRERVANYTTETAMFVNQTQALVDHPNRTEMVVLYDAINSVLKDVKQFEAYVIGERDELVETLVQRFVFERAEGDLHTIHRELNHLLDILRQYVQTTAPPTNVTTVTTPPSY